MNPGTTGTSSEVLGNGDSDAVAEVLDVLLEKIVACFAKYP